MLIWRLKTAVFWPRGNYPADHFRPKHPDSQPIGQFLALVGESICEVLAILWKQHVSDARAITVNLFKQTVARFH